LEDIGIALAIVPHGDRSEKISKLELDNCANPPPLEFSASGKARDCEPSHLEVTVPGYELIDQCMIAANGRGAFPTAPGAVHVQRFGECNRISANAHISFLIQLGSEVKTTWEHREQRGWWVSIHGLLAVVFGQPRKIRRERPRRI
jgi:hypothetical protein